MDQKQERQDESADEETMTITALDLSVKRKCDAKPEPELEVDLSPPAPLDLSRRERPSMLVAVIRGPLSPSPPSSPPAAALPMAVKSVAALPMAVKSVAAPPVAAKPVAAPSVAAKAVAAPSVATQSDTAPLMATQSDTARQELQNRRAAEYNSFLAAAVAAARPKRTASPRPRSPQPQPSVQYQHHHHLLLHHHVAAFDLEDAAPERPRATSPACGQATSTTTSSSSPESPVSPELPGSGLFRAFDYLPYHFRYPYMGGIGAGGGHHGARSGCLSPESTTGDYHHLHHHHEHLLMCSAAYGGYGGFGAAAGYAFGAAGGYAIGTAGGYSGFGAAAAGGYAVGAAGGYVVGGINRNGDDDDDHFAGDLLPREPVEPEEVAAIYRQSDFLSFRQRYLESLGPPKNFEKMRRTVPSKRPVPDGDVTYVMKRKKNNEAAKRSRDAKRQKYIENQISVMYLTKKVNEMKEIKRRLMLTMC